jgi:hypothetical protein
VYPLTMFPRICVRKFSRSCSFNENNKTTSITSSRATSFQARAS